MHLLLWEPKIHISWLVVQEFPNISICLPTSFRPSLSWQFPMSCGSDNPLSSRLWATYQAHLPNLCSLVIVFESFIYETTLSSTGTSGPFIEPNGWEFQKEIEQKCMHIFNSLRTGWLTPSRWQCYEDSGLLWGSCYPLDLSNWWWSQPRRKMWFMSLTQKHYTIYSSK